DRVMEHCRGEDLLIVDAEHVPHDETDAKDMTDVRRFLVFAHLPLMRPRGKSDGVKQRTQGQGRGVGHGAPTRTGPRMDTVAWVSARPSPREALSHNGQPAFRRTQ